MGLFGELGLERVKCSCDFLKYSENYFDLKAGTVKLKHGENELINVVKFVYFKLSKKFQLKNSCTLA